jgi:tripeptidyl-peptidase I
MFTEELIERETFKRVQRSSKDLLHEVIISLKKNNLEKLERIVLERATVNSENYQKWLTFDEVTNIVSNDHSHSKVVEFLKNHQISINWTSKRKDYIKAVATIAQWESLLNAEFYEHEDLTLSKHMRNNYHRSNRYLVPLELQDHVIAIFNTVQVPPPFHPKFAKRRGKQNVQSIKSKIEVSHNDKFNRLGKAFQVDGTTTIGFINYYYNISHINQVGSGDIQQSVFETTTEYYSTNDLKAFQLNYNLSIENPISIGGHQLTDCPVDSTSQTCVEGNLDIQYIMGAAQNVTTVFWYVSASQDPFLAWIIAAGNEKNPPTSNSISWGIIEWFESSSIMTAFNTEALILAAQGVTILVASGDNGAANEATTSSGQTCLCNYDSSSSTLMWRMSNSWKGTGYFPIFPATSPYVTAVGATQGPEFGYEEIASQSQEGGVITSGGGFSMYFSRPSWQSTVVEDYLKNTSFSPGYNPNGRGYPDISLIGTNYQIMLYSTIQSVYGTSASTPVLAAWVSLVNSKRSREGKSSIGWLNPTLYAIGYNNSLGVGNIFNAKFNDITSGHNRCCSYTGDTPSDATCCASGFTTACGWDPVTGWGSIDYPHFEAMFLQEPLAWTSSDNITCNISADTVSKTSSSNSKSQNEVGIIVGIILGVALLTLVVIAILRCKRKRDSAAERGPYQRASTQGLLVQQVPVVPVVEVVVYDPKYNHTV